MFYNIIVILIKWSSFVVWIVTTEYSRLP